MNIFDLSNYSPSLYSLPTAVVSLGIMILGCVIIIRDRGSIMSFSFFLMTCAFSVWFFAFSFMYSSVQEKTALFWARVAYLGVPSIPASIFQFVVCGLGIYRKWKTAVIINWAISIAFSAIIISSNALIGSLYRYWWGFYPRYGWLSIPFLLYFILAIGACIIFAFEAFSNAPKRTVYRERMKGMTVALGICSIGVVDFVAKFGVPLYPFAYIPFSLFLIISIFLVRRYRMVEITPAFAAEIIVETMSDILLAVDRDGVVHLANREAAVFFGKKVKDLVGKQVEDVIGDQSFMQRIMQSLVKGELRNHELRYAIPGGSFRTLSISASMVYELETTPAGIIFAARDITELKEREAELRKAYDEINERQRIADRNLMIASNLQAQLLPERAPINKEWDIAFIFRPKAGVSGDFYDFYEDSGILKGLALFDVSGHGISSGLITLLARSIISRHFNSLDKQPLNSVAESINRDLIRELKSVDTFITGIMLRFKEKDVEYINAGHTNLFVKRKKTGVVMTVKPKDRDFRGMILGKHDLQQGFDVLRFSLERGDSLLLYTDGFTDCRLCNEDIEYGDVRLKESFAKAPDSKAEIVLEHLIQDLEKSTEGGRINDDITAIVIRKR